MTICIAGIVENSRIIAITDKMLTLNNTPVTKYEINENNKAIKLNESTVGLFSGDVIVANEILNIALLKDLENKSVKEVANLVNDSYREYWQSVIDNFLIRKYMLDFKTFMDNHSNLEADLVKQVTKMLSEYTIDVEIIIAGVDDNPHLFVVNNLGTVISRDSIGYSCIGSGSQHATLSLIESRFNTNIKFNKGIYSLIEAKKRAEFDPGVGSLCDLVIINDKVDVVSDLKLKKILKHYSDSQSDFDKIIDNYSEKIVGDLA